MKLTEELKDRIDEMSYEQLLTKWRFASIGDLMFRGESGEYFGKRMAELRNQPDGNEVHVRASKKIGWG